MAIVLLRLLLKRYAITMKNCIIILDKFLNIKQVSKDELTGNSI